MAVKKRFLIILSVVSTLAFYTNAQVADSLWNIWNNQQHHDTVRLEALRNFLQGNEFFPDGFLSLEPDSGYSLSESMYVLSTSKGYKEYEMWSLLLKGEYYFFWKRDLAKAIDYYTKALKTAEEINDDELKMISLVSLGIGEYWNNEISEAEGHFLEALRVFQNKSSKLSELELGSKLSSYGSWIHYNLGYLNKYKKEDYNTAKEFYERALTLIKRDEASRLFHTAFREMTGTLYHLRDYPESVSFYSSIIERATETNESHWIAHGLIGLGSLYREVGEYKLAENYFSEALTMIQESESRFAYEQLDALNGLIDVFMFMKNYSAALETDSLFLNLAKEFRPSVIPNGLGMQLEIYFLQGEYSKVLKKGLKYLTDFQDMKDTYFVTFVKLQIGKAYSKLNLYSEAIFWCEKAYSVQGRRNWYIKKEACECLYESHKGLKHGDEALAYFEEFRVWKDTLEANELSTELQKMEFDRQMIIDSVEKVEEARLINLAHQEEVRAKDKQRNILMYSGVLILAFSVGLWSQLRYVRKSKAALQTEKDRSENLLLNILPAEIAEELKTKGKADARHFERVSILFTDFKEFTQTSEKLTVQALVEEINICFAAFDAICFKYEIEKIKTIGDAYMAAGGVPVPTFGSTKNTVLAALEMQQFITQRKEVNSAGGKAAFEMRAGIHTGPVVAGIVGAKKFQYDIWGDTVNTASRMESAGDVGQVNISQDTYEFIKDEQDLSFIQRGKIEVKGKGKMNMYFVRRT